MKLEIEKFVGSKLLVSWSLDEEENDILSTAENPYVIISTSLTDEFDMSNDMKSERRFYFPLKNGKGYIAFSGPGEHTIKYTGVFNKPELWTYQYYSSYCQKTVFAERLDSYFRSEDNKSTGIYVPDYIFAAKSTPTYFNKWKNLYLTSSFVKEDTKCVSWLKTLFAIMFQPFIFTLDILARLFLFYLSFMLFMDGFLKLEHFNVAKFSLADVAFNLFQKRLFCEKPPEKFGFDPEDFGFHNFMKYRFRGLFNPLLLLTIVLLALNFSYLLCIPYVVYFLVSIVEYLLVAVFYFLPQYINNIGRNQKPRDYQSIIEKNKKKNSLKFMLDTLKAKFCTIYKP